MATQASSQRLLVAVTKMEDVSWSQDRFDEVATALTPKITNAGRTNGRIQSQQTDIHVKVKKG